MMGKEDDGQGEDDWRPLASGRAPTGREAQAPDPRMAAGRPHACRPGGTKQPAPTPSALPRPGRSPPADLR